MNQLWRRAAFVLVVAFVCLVAAVPATWAQSDTAQISGFVKDPTGAVVPNAGVAIKNEATGLERKTTTTASGYYVVPNLPPGYYTLTVEAPGFKKYIKTQNKLDPSIPATIDAELQVGALAETVSVTAEAVMLQSETATVGKLVDGKQIENMMLNGRNPFFLAQLKPGVQGGTLAGFSYGLSSGLRINGGRDQDNLIAIDGAPAIRTRANGTSIGVVDVDSLQEIQILTANYNAEYGRAGGGQIRFVTRSGSRDFHAKVFEYFRNTELNANSWSNNKAGAKRPADKFNQFGYNLSGPVYIPGKLNKDRNKLFFLWSQEYIRRRRESTAIITVPTNLMRQGNFSELIDRASPYYQSKTAINDPQQTGAVFAGGIIPQARWSTNGMAFINALPAPNARPGIDLAGRNNFIQTRPQPEDIRKDTISIDFIPGQNHNFRFRGQNFMLHSIDAFRDNTDRAVTTWSRPNKTTSLNYIWTVSPTMVNEFNASASVDRVFIGILQEGQRWDRTKYGINYPYIFPEKKEIYNKIPTVEMSNFQILQGSPYPSSSTGPIYVFSDNISKTHGSHTFKAGVLFERSGQNDFDQINVSGVPGGSTNQNGRFVFTDGRANATGTAISNAALGLFDTYAEIGQRASTPYRAQMFEWFVQDSWKATSKLRLEFGLRHTVQTPYYYSLWGNIAVFDPNRYDPKKAVQQDPKTGFISPGVGDLYNGVFFPGKGWPKAAKGRIALADSGQFDRLWSGSDANYWGQRQWLNFQPRVGVAYSLNTKTVVRAGGGQFTARPAVSDNIFLGGNPPLQPMVSVSNGLADRPGGAATASFPLFFMTSDPVFKIPTAWNWNFTLQREIGFGTTVTVGYVGRVGLHLERERNLNQLPVGTLKNPANSGLNTDYLRPYKGFANIPMSETAARSKYDGLQIEVSRRFTKGLQFGVAYTRSAAYDNGSSRRDRFYSVYKNYWGYFDNHTPHMMVINYTYQLPFLRGGTKLVNKLGGGWQFSGITQFQTGGPFSIGYTGDYAGIGSSDAQPWEAKGNPIMDRGARTFSMGAADSNYWINVKAADGSALFTEPAAGTFSKTVGKQMYCCNPGFQNWNLALFKDFTITEKGQKVQFRFETFNFINHPNWSGADYNPRSSTFGKVSSKTSERNVQMVLRYEF